MKSLTLAFACIGERLPSLLANLSSIESPPQVKVVILVQKPLRDTQKIADSNSSVHIKILDSIGLSKSRNQAILISETDFIWFLDDDVQLVNKDINKALAIINNVDAEFFRVKIGCIEWPEKTFKKYKKTNKIRKLNLLQISSIEIIADLGFIKKNKITFNEKIGLGTNFNACEENNFLIDAWNLGARFEYINEVLVSHTCIFDERILANNAIFEIRGATASRFGFIGFLLILRWLLRYSFKERKVSYLTSLIKGYLKGYLQYS